MHQVRAKLKQQNQDVTGFVEARIETDGPAGWYGLIELPTSGIRAGAYQLVMPDGAQCNIFVERMVAERTAFFIGLGLMPHR